MESLEKDQGRIKGQCKEVSKKVSLEGVLRAGVTVRKSLKQRLLVCCLSGRVTGRQT